MKKRFTTSLLILLSFMFLNFSYVTGQDQKKFPGNDNSGYKVILGERPPIDLTNVPKDAYEPGKLKIKLNPALEGMIPEEPVHAGAAGYVITGIASLDLLNEAFGVTQYKPLFAQLYQTGSRSSQFEERHRAWGFHLWLELLIDPRMDVIDAVKQFSALREVEFAEPEYRKRLVIDDPVLNGSDPEKFPDNTSGNRWAPNDPQYNNQWHYNNTGQQNGTPGADISLEEAWEIEKGNSNVIVAIVDGGIEYTHEDLSGNMWPGIGYNFVAGNANVVGHYHGTHVAGTVAAATNNAVGVAGVAGGSGSNNGVRLMSCQVFTSSSNGGFHLAPVYAADNGASISQNSWGYTSPGVYDQSVLNAIDYFNTNGGGFAMDGGITIFAAGNSQSSGAWYPGYYSGCFSVAATNNQDQKAWYSNYDTWIDISAPGGETNTLSARGVLSTYTGNSYAYLQGTSMACPHTSGVAALMISLAYGELTPVQVADILRTTTDDHYAVNPSFIGKLGTGRLNAHAALTAVQSILSAIPNPQNFNAVAVSESQINLSWIKNADNNDVMIVWAEDGIIGVPVEGVNYLVGSSIEGGGIVLYRGSNTSFAHTGLESITTFYYKAFSYDLSNIYSNGVAANATTLVGPEADFAASPTLAIVGETITFTDASVGGPFSVWSWDFGDGANPPTASGQGPHTVIYNSVGCKTVSLLVDNQHTITKVNYITITDIIYSASATYTNGDIPTDYDFRSLPGASSCPGLLSVSIPVEATIGYINVSYNMTALNNGWKSEQRSQLRCVSPDGLAEKVLFSGTGATSGTQPYNRSGLTIANGITGGGIIQFELHAGRTWGGSECTAYYNKVDNNTWTVTVFYSLPAEPEADFAALLTTIYEGESVYFTDLSTNSPTIWSWDLPGGNPANSSDQNPVVIYQTPGIYDVTLTVTNQFGSDTVTKAGYITVEVLPLPEADFIASATIIDAGESISFTDLSTNSPTSWSWDFPEGSPANSTDQNPVIVYDTPGVYNVSLTVTNEFGSDTETKTGYITVLEDYQIIADFTANKTEIFKGQVVQFYDQSSGEPTFWKWEIAGGTPSVNYQQNPSIIFNAVGEFDVKLTVSSAYGQSIVVKENYIKVLPVPSLLPPGWEYTNTGMQHVIAVPLASNPRILDVPLAPYDFIGVFYTNSFGELKCGGATQWNGTSNIAVTAYGDNNFTPLKDGFSVNEVFTWKIFSNCHERDFIATPSYVPMVYQGTFFPMGMSALSDLYAGVVFQVNVPAGWSGISSPVLPYFPDFLSLFMGVEDLTIIYNYNGMFWPGQNINTLYDWNIAGYTIKMEMPAILEFGGDLITERDYEVETGTGFLPVLSPCEVATVPLFVPHLSKLIMVRNVLGTQVYWPMFGINTLETLEPGQAYLVIASAGFTVEFPLCQSKSDPIAINSEPGSFPATSWMYGIPTPSVHSVAVTREAAASLEKGDVVGVFTAADVCNGWAVYEGNSMVIPVYGNDFTNENPNGFVLSEQMNFQLFRPSTNQQYDLQVSWSKATPDHGHFKVGGISAVENLQINPKDSEALQSIEFVNIYPNPGSGLFTISGVGNAEQILVASPDGRVVFETFTNGDPKVEMNLTGLSKGVYMVKLVGGISIQTKKIIIE